MNKNNLITILQSRTLNYNENLIAFFNTYVEYSEYLYEYALSSKASDKERYIISYFGKWLDDEGYVLLIRTIEQLSNSNESKILKFIQLYEFLMSSSTDSIEKLIDHLFYIPEQFFSQFVTEKHSLVGKIDETDCMVINSSANYTLIRKGIFEIPFFDKWRIYL